MAQLIYIQVENGVARPLVDVIDWKRAPGSATYAIKLAPLQLNCYRSIPIRIFSLSTVVGWRH